MTNDHAELRAVAQAANAKNPGPWTGKRLSLTFELGRYLDAAQPTAVLALLDELDAAVAERDALKVDVALYRKWAEVSKEREKQAREAHDELWRKFNDNDALQQDVRNFLEALSERGTCDVLGCGCVYSEGVAAVRALAAKAATDAP